MTQRLPCNRCGESIHPDTAAKNDGLCLPCKGGYRDRIEAGKKRREDEQLYLQSEKHRYWEGLVKRVHDERTGLDRIAPAEKTYYAVSCLIDEVHNGGFSQFFSNSSGSLCGLAIDGLMELEAETSTALLLRAKEAAFGDRPIPANQRARWDAMADTDAINAELNRLDKLFCEDPDRLGERCAKFAKAHELYV